jgi:hypothetical protein
LGFLKQYIVTKPRDSVPYVILGESELEKKNYRAADGYLREAKMVAHGQSTHLDWLLFQSSYLTGDYAYASAILESAITKAQFLNEFKNLVSDPRFSGMEKRPEFRKYEPMIKGTAAKANP